MNIFIRWLIASIAVVVAAYILPGVTVENFFVALVTAIVIGVINTFLKPIILILTLPFNVLTLGLFTFVINALLIMLASAVVPGFEVASFWWALFFSLILSLVNAVLRQ